MSRRVCTVKEKGQAGTHLSTDTVTVATSHRGESRTIARQVTSPFSVLSAPFLFTRIASFVTVKFRVTHSGHPDPGTSGSGISPSPTKMSSLMVSLTLREGGWGLGGEGG